MESTDSAFAIGGILFLLFAVVVGVAAFVFWLWMLIHALTNNGISGSEKVAWVLVILFTNFIGCLIYFFVGRPKSAMAGASG